mmetsp:Transcript_19663/g.36390  ORF Transcript_19663/g.36390 Transcript_19663/m.36390 type:complete len:1244 (+) Transcript_19663:1-3732(+)
MATSDICTELQNDVKFPSNTERQICQAVLKQLDDSSHDVQAVAVRCLSILVKKVDQAQVTDICSKLCSLILEEKAELRDMYSIGLKTALSNLPEKMGAEVAEQLSVRLLLGIKIDDNEGIKLECLDILTDLIKLYGTFMSNDHVEISSVVLKQLGHSSPLIRKRATACLGRLATMASNTLLNQIVKELLAQIETPAGSANKRVIIHTIGTISRMVGYRLGSHLGEIIPLFLGALKAPEDESMQTEESDELRENVLQAFVSFVKRCPAESAEHIPAILTIMLQFMQYDPNYSYGEDDEDVGMEEDYEDYDDFDDDDYSDEDDTSWKVRRASIKVVRAIIASRYDLIEDLYVQCAPLLLDRFKERDDNVKLDIIGCYTDLASGSKSGMSGSPLARDSHYVPKGQRTANEGKAGPELVSLVVQDIPKLIKISCKVLRDKKATKTKSAVLTMLREVTVLVRGGFEEHLTELLPLVLDACHLERESSLVHDALMFLGQVIQVHQPKHIQPHLKEICPQILACVSAEWYKIVAEALKVVSAMIGVIRPKQSFDGREDDVMSDAIAIPSNASELVQSCFVAVLPRLQTHDIDMEIKENAISCMGTLFSRTGDMLTSELDSVLSLLQERLSNETTRLSALKCIEEIASSRLNLDLSKAAPALMKELTPFLRQQSRTLRQHSLVTMNALARSSGVSMDSDIFTETITSTSKLINAADLYVSKVALDLVVSILATKKCDVRLVQDVVLPEALNMIRTVPLQGSSTLTSLLMLLEILVKLDTPGFGYNEVLNVLVNAANDESSPKFTKSGIDSLSKCVAAVCLACPDQSMRDNTIIKIAVDISQGLAVCKGYNVVLHLSLLSLGAIGCSFDLSTVVPDSRNTIVQCLDNPNCSEEMKSAAATTLGNMSLGNIAVYLPLLMQDLNDRTEQAHQYLLLSSLRQVIAKHSSSLAVSQAALPVNSILPVLERHCASEEEGVRNMVSECLGKLAILDPQNLIPHFAKLAETSSDVNVRWTLVTSLKYAAGWAQTENALKAHIMPFVVLLGDEDLGVCKAAIVALNAIAHHRPSILRDVAKEHIIPKLFDMLPVKASLKRIVDLGPFKHTVDDGLPLRKASFACVLTMLDTMPDVIPLTEFFPHLAKGLADVDDVAMLCHQIVQQIAAWSPLVLLSEVGTVIVPLAATLSKVPKQTPASLNEGSDVIRSALRALDAIACIPEAQSNAKVTEVVSSALSRDHLVEMMYTDNLSIAKKNVKA